MLDILTSRLNSEPCRYVGVVWECGLVALTVTATVKISLPLWFLPSMLSTFYSATYVHTVVIGYVFFAECFLLFSSSGPLPHSDH